MFHDSGAHGSDRRDVIGDEERDEDPGRPCLARRHSARRHLSLAKTSSDSVRSAEIRQSVHRSKTPSLVGGRVGRPASLDRRPCTVTPESRWRTGSGRAERLSWTCEACSMVVRTAGASLRRLADVAVMQATDFGNLHNPARLGELDGPDVRRILVEREMRASPVIAGGGRRKERAGGEAAGAGG